MVPKIHVLCEDMEKKFRFQKNPNVNSISCRIENSSLNFVAGHFILLHTQRAIEHPKNIGYSYNLIFFAPLHSKWWWNAVCIPISVCKILQVNFISNNTIIFSSSWSIDVWFVRLIGAPNKLWWKKRRMDDGYQANGYTIAGTEYSHRSQSHRHFLIDGWCKTWHCLS